MRLSRQPRGTVAAATRTTGARGGVRGAAAAMAVSPTGPVGGWTWLGMAALEGSGPKPINGSAGFWPMMLRPFPAGQQRAARREDLGQFMRPWAQ